MGPWIPLNPRHVGDETMRRKVGNVAVSQRKTFYSLFSDKSVVMRIDGIKGMLHICVSKRGNVSPIFPGNTNNNIDV